MLSKLLLQAFAFGYGLVDLTTNPTAQSSNAQDHYYKPYHQFKRRYDRSQVEASKYFING